VAKSVTKASSVKGSLFFIAQADLLGLIERGAILREALEVRLTREQLELVDAKVQVALWYPIDAFNAFLRITSEVSGRSSPEALAATGRLSAEHLAQSGLYPQLTSARGGSARGVGRRLVTLASAFYNFMHWEYIEGEDPHHFTVDVTDAADWCEELRHITEGFIEVASSGATGRSVRVTSERPTPGHVIFHGCPAD
jgi:uncharacterized protein Smg (DUF494 family)